MQLDVSETTRPIVHVGLGKTGTTSLQGVVFPELARLGHVTSFNPAQLIDAIVTHLQKGEPAPLVTLDSASSLPGPMVSMESLAGWNPAHWPEHAASTAAMFPRSTTILITLRDPESYIRSVYQQLVSIGNVVPPEKIILGEATYLRTARFSRTCLCETFNVDRLDYQALVNEYTSRFDRVVVVAMSRLADLNFLTDLCGISEAELCDLRKVFGASRPRNRSYSAFGMALTQLRERLLASLGLKTLGSHDNFFYLNFDPGKAPRWRRWLRYATRWSTFIAALDHLGLGRQSYCLPDSIPRGLHFGENRAFITDLEAQASGYRLIGSARGKLAPCTASNTALRGRSTTSENAE